MSNGTAARHNFLPWVRQGVATGISQPETLGAGVPGRTILPVILKVNDTDVTVNVRLYGPGDVTGIDPRQVIRTEPRPLAMEFEPNYFPAIEFDRPDFPWLFTPAKPNDQEQLRPWIFLVVVRKQEGVSLVSDPHRPLPVLEITSPANPADELPDLQDSWAWVHGQVSSSPDGPSLDYLLAHSPERTLSRLICPRKLEANMQYYACLVPAFKAGVSAGLGEEVDEDAELEPAWGANIPAEIHLPIYFHWEFGTGPAGDFEALARRLQPRELPQEIGRRPMDVRDPGWGLPPASTLLGLEGALRAPESAPMPWPDEERSVFQQELRAILNPPENPDAPIVAPPVYGCWHAAQLTVPADEDGPHWLRELNLDPRHRAAAGFGTRVVQEQQEQLMAAAWGQAGELSRANQVLRQAQLARSVGSAIRDKHLSQLAPGELLQLTRPVHAQVRVSARKAMTLERRLAESRIPLAAVSATFRRLARPRGPLARRLLPPDERHVRPIVERLNRRSIAAAPPRKAPGGTVSLDDVSASFAGDYVGLRYGRATPGAVRSARGWQQNGAAVTRAARRPPRWGDPDDPDIPELPPLPDEDGDAPAMVERFRQAAAAHQAHLLSMMKDGAPGDRRAALAASDGTVAVGYTRQRLMQRLDPDVTILQRVRERIDAGEQVWRRDDPLEPIMVVPNFPRPMYEALRDLSQDLVLPGLDRVPPDTVALLETNPRFVEAYMVGLNHEMSRELLWREYPTDQRGTYFRQFWRVTNGGTQAAGTEDVSPIDTWDSGNHLGENYRRAGLVSQVVLLIRGELLRRYPTATIYAVKATWTPDGQRRVPGNEERYPVFRGTLEPDVTFLGFDLTVMEARGSPDPAARSPGWFFVIQQQPTEPRFGLDVAATFGDDPSELASWKDLTWGHLVENKEAFEALTHAHIAGRLKPPDKPPLTIGNLTWGQNGGHMASITRQLPARMAVHASGMLGEPPSLRITCATKTNVAGQRRIGAIGGVYADGTRWKLSQQEAIEAIEQGHLEFRVEQPVGDPVAVIVARGQRGYKYLKTVADGDEPNNLLALPECP